MIDNKYYLYRHVRLDKNEVFYIGVGTKFIESRTFERTYQRAFVKRARSDFWNNVVAKTEYRVDILFESDDYDFINNKEIEFIKLYGRKVVGEGTLVNHSIGGGGNKGWIPDEKFRENLSKRMKGVPRTENEKRLLSEKAKGRTISEETRKRLSDSHKNITLSKESREKLSNSLRGIKRTDEMKAKYRAANLGSTHGCKYRYIAKDENNNIIKIFENSQILRESEFKYEHVRHYISKKRKDKNGYFWEKELLK